MIVVEDTAEVQLHRPNNLGLIAVKGDLGSNRVGGGGRGGRSRAGCTAGPSVENR